MPSKTWSEIEGVVKMVGHLGKYTTPGSLNASLKIGVIVKWRELIYIKVVSLVASRKMEGIVI